MKYEKALQSILHFLEAITISPDSQGRTARRSWTGRRRL